MPIVINEIVISVEAGANQPAQQANATASANEALIRECVERVMELLNQQKER